MVESFGNYNLIKRFKLDFTDVVVSKWKSSVTGLTVIHLDYDAPIVQGRFVVATESFDDSGCAHSVEHLVFMGSEKYPHKGILDLLAHHAFSSGTSAWTNIDHTAISYNHRCGIYHIDEKGQDSGVMYSEMQRWHNDSDSLMTLRLTRLLNAAGSGYRSKKHGSMKALRVLTPEQIRKYHASYYVPHNLALIVAGKLTEGTSSLLRVVQEQVEPSLIQHNQNKGSRPAGWKRPFVETPSAQRKPIPTTMKSLVEFPDEDESMGKLIIGFLGPPPNDFLTRNALTILGLYLTSSKNAPLNKEYIEIESPLCSAIYFIKEICATCTDLRIYISSVPTRNLDAFNEKLMASLNRIVENGIDTQRMAIVVNRYQRQLRSWLERSKATYFSQNIADDFLYGAEDGSELHPSMNGTTYCNILRCWTSSQWTALLSRFYIEQPSVVVLGKPSANLAHNLEKAKKTRITNRVEKLGPEGLKEVAQKLEAAKETNNKPIPVELITSFPVPDVESISWIPVQTVQELGIGRKANSNVASTDEELRKHIESDGKPLPFFVEYDHVKSDFVSVHAFFSLAKLPNHLRPYFSAYLSAFFSLPVVRHNGVRVTHEDLVDQLDDDTVSYEVGLGVSGNFMNIFRISIEVELAAYETGVAWLRDLIYGTKFEKKRIQIVLAKIQQSLAEKKRDGMTVLCSLWRELMLAENSMSRLQDVLSQAEWIPKLSQRLQESPEDVLADFESIRKHVIDPSGVRFSVTGNILGVKQPRSTWAKYFDLSLPPPLSPVPLKCQTLSDIGRNCSRQAFVMSLPSIESSYTLLTTKCIQGFDHSEYPVIRLALGILNATEDFIWRHIRGSGLAYWAYLHLNVEAGQLEFVLDGCSNTMEALEEAASMMRGLVDGSIKLTDTAVTAAVSALVSSVAENVSTASGAAMDSFVNQALKGVPRSHHIDLLEKCRTIKKEDILAAFQKYFIPLFDPASSVAFVVTAPGNAQSIAEGLSGLGFDVTQKELHVEPADMETQLAGKSLAAAYQHEIQIYQTCCKL